MNLSSNMSMLDRVVTCITKPCENRQDDEIHYLLPWLRKMSDKFESLRPEVLFEILKNCSYSEKGKNDIIIRQGDKGDCFYVILSGHVSIFINTEAVPDDPEEVAVPIVEEGIQRSTEEVTRSNKKELDRSKYGNYIAMLESGKAFGELALINADCIRNASIIADDNVQLLIVNRNLYNSSMREAELAEFNQKMSFVTKSPLFSGWLSRYRKQAAFSLRKEKFGFDDPLVIQGSSTNGLTFILKGQAKVVVNAHLHEIQYPSLGYMLSNEDGRNLDLSEIERSMELDGKRQVQNKIHKRLAYCDAEERRAQRNIEICIITAGEVIGDLEQGLELSTYSQSVIAIEPTVVYVLDAKNFERLINIKRNPHTLRDLKTMAVSKVKYRSKMTTAVGGRLASVSFYTRIDELLRREEEDNQKQSGKAISNKIEDILMVESTIGAVGTPNLASGGGGNLSHNAALNQVLDPNYILSHRGPLIDMFGPGSVFYRNRMIRKEKRIADYKRKKVQMALKGQSGLQRGLTTIPPIYSVPHPDDESDDYFNKDDAYRKLDSLVTHGLGNAQIGKVIDIEMTICDWETTSERLRGLEDRIRNWLSSVSSLNAANTSDLNESSFNRPLISRRLGSLSAPQGGYEFCATLKRFDPKEYDKKLIPGKKIFLKPKKIVKSLKLADVDDTRDQVFITARATDTFVKPSEIGVDCVKEGDGYGVEGKGEGKGVGGEGRGGGGVGEEGETNTRKDTDEQSKNSRRKKKASDSYKNSNHSTTNSPLLPEYKQLKQLLKKKEREMQVFKLLSI